MINFSELWQYILTAEGTHKLEAFGDILQYAIAWFALIVVALTGDAALAHAWVYAGICQMLIVEALKRALNNTTLGPRPNGGKHSFPSGHTAGAFFGATFIVAVWGPWWGIVPVILAAITGLSRVVANKHWPRDVIAGALIAAMCSYTAVIHMVG